MIKDYRYYAGNCIAGSNPVLLQQNITHGIDGEIGRHDRRKSFINCLPVKAEDRALSLKSVGCGSHVGSIPTLSQPSAGSSVVERLKNTLYSLLASNG
jgi:hypothetical protein